MGNSQSQNIIAKAEKAATELKAGRLDEQAIRRAETAHNEILASIREARFDAERLVAVTQASEAFRLTIKASRERLEEHQERQRTAEQKRRREAELKLGSDASGRIKHVEESLRASRLKLRTLETEWQRSLRSDQKNQHDYPLDSVSEQFYKSDEPKALLDQQETLKALLSKLKEAEGQPATDQLVALDASRFVDALDRASHGRDPFPVSIPDPLRRAFDQLRSSLPGTPDGDWDIAVGRLLDAGLSVAVILRTPVADSGTRKAYENFVGREGGIWPESDAVKEARRVFKGDPLEDEIVRMIEAMKGGAGHGARLRSRAPEIVLAGNSAGFNLAQAEAFAFVHSVGTAWVSAVSTSDSGGSNPTKIRGEI